MSNNQQFMNNQQKQMLERRQQAGMYEAWVKQRQDAAFDTPTKKAPLIFRALGWIWRVFWTIVAFMIMLGILFIIVSILTNSG